MAKWFYTNEKGERIEVTGGQLKGLAKAGRITPDTIIETAEGKSAPARKVKGLTFVAPTQFVESKATQNVATPSYFFIDANGQQQGPVNEQQLKALAERGIITPTTPLTTDAGHKGVAGQIRGLFNAPAPTTNQTTPQSVPVPATEQSGGSSWQVTVIGAVLILIAGGMAWQFLAKHENNRPPAGTRVVEVPANVIPPAQGITPVQAQPQQGEFIEPNPFLNVVPADFSF